jgi:uncharacterized Zn-finger protein
MTYKLILKKNHPKRCQVKGCHNRGVHVTLDVGDGAAAEFDCLLCEDHYAEARGCGQ